MCFLIFINYLQLCLQYSRFSEFQQKCSFLTIFFLLSMLHSRSSFPTVKNIFAFHFTPTSPRDSDCCERRKSQQRKKNFVRRRENYGQIKLTMKNFFFHFSSALLKVSQTCKEKRHPSSCFVSSALVFVALLTLRFKWEELH